MQFKLPNGAIVLLIGPSNSGKTTLLRSLVDSDQLIESEIISSDYYRRLVADIDFIDLSSVSKNDEDIIYEEYQRISEQAFHALHTIVEARAKLNRVSIIDATNLRAFERAKYFEIAKRNHVPVLALILNIPKEQLLARDVLRGNPRGRKRVLQQFNTLKYELKAIKKEPFAKIYKVDDESVEIVREPNKLYLEIESGFDIIGDIHGCYDEMLVLLKDLGYEQRGDVYIHPAGRRLISVGDIMSRGPKSIETMQFWLNQIEAGLSFMTDSNHGWKIARWLDGKNVSLNHGDELVQQEFTEYEKEHGEEAAEALKERFASMLLKAPSHYILTKNKITKAVVTHAGIKDHYIGKESKRISDFCRYGDIQQTDSSSKPVRGDWFSQHKTSELIIWGHDVKVQPFKANRTINIDQGVVFGGELTAFQYPEQTLRSVKAFANYAGTEDNPILEAENKRFSPPNAAQFLNGYAVHTTSGEQIAIPKENAMAAMDTFSHYTLPLEQVIYIPPTMSPTPQTAALPDYLEHPAEAFNYYKKNGIQKMIAEKKHMGSRAVIFIAKNREVAKKLINSDSLGYITTRTGRAFFEKLQQQQMVGKIHAELMAKNYFERFNTSFVLMDAEILPWNLKAHRLIDQQYETVAENALMDRYKLIEKLKATKHVDVTSWLEEYTDKYKNAARFDAVFKNYCWPTNELSGIQIAPFHILAHSSSTNFHQSHSWHMQMNAHLAENSSLFIATEYRVIESELDKQEVINWWQDMTENGHEGIVIKPFDFLAYHKGKLLQPAIKVRGREYLRIIYGMDYTDEAIMKKLKQRNPSRKMKNALLEFKLGLEGISRFVSLESSNRVHECALATLALESDTTDPRL
ncbi:polynucleotide kinase-phosphatase [Solibacillus kalamii]|uniref:Polynucleotide kinase-phosphatase n=1 Tax=Solibacillus kalamii TaxID=1748298 RepID=A0ABX3ZHV2_9BACL|nr:AAA family ATPase [Solibacillus kalamii]MBM7663592.1 polynucleotide kinase-phosphatase [Solibacillus kalamii]OUZ39148.1 polynucleotide kinase-phosphatase [Solibacillus kalamii]